MGRAEKIKLSICGAILNTDPDNGDDEPTEASIAQSFKSFFKLRSLTLRTHRPQTFSSLRREWHLTQASYRDSFAPDVAENAADVLKASGSMGGYSGSTFFTTHDSNYLIKSVPRQFEHSFFRDDLLTPYSEHMLSNLDSLLIRITDFLTPAPDCRVTIGTLLGLVPTHHIVMENLLTGQAEAERAARIAAARRREHAEGRGKWETWDLKPKNYFFPERDVAGGKLASEATKSNLADIFNGEICLSKKQANEFLSLLEKDTKVLEEANAVDYSLFLIRIPLNEPQNEERAREQQPPAATDGSGDDANGSMEDPFSDDHATEICPASGTTQSKNAPPTPSHPPFAPPSPPSWRTGVSSADGKYVFRATILDFFWAKHKTHAKMMTGLINFWNVFNKQGPMSITTTPAEYRERFLRMCRSFVKVVDENEEDGQERDDSPRRSG